MRGSRCGYIRQHSEFSAYQLSVGSNYEQVRRTYAEILAIVVPISVSNDMPGCAISLVGK